MTAERLVLIDGVRTPFCKMGTDLASLAPDELGRVAVNTLLTHTGLDPAIVDEVIFGCVSQPADTANVARVIALRSGIPERVPAFTVHRNCASGCEAFTQAFEKMAAGRGSVFIVGGTESMSQIPLFYTQSAAKKFAALSRAKTFGQRLGALSKFRPADFQPRVGLQLGLSDPVCGMNMGETAERVAQDFGITRDEQDQFALLSHQRAAAAKDKLAAEIAPVFVNGKTITADNGVRAEQSIEALSKLKPVFDRKNGSVTAGNASQITDGAVALLVMSESKAQFLGLEPLAAMTTYAYAGCDPTRMGLGPVFAIARAEAQSGLSLADADVIEINEAFAAQVLGCIKAAESPKFARKLLSRDTPLGTIPRDRLNVNGGAIALGHPVGSTGARLILTAVRELRRRNGRRALVSLCVGGGQGAAIWLEKI